MKEKEQEKLWNLYSITNRMGGKVDYTAVSQVKMAKFVYYNLNPKQLHVNDCMARALAYFLGVTWHKAFLDIVEWCARRGWVEWNFRSKYYVYLSELGYERHKAPEKGMTAGRFCDEFAEDGKVYMIQIKRHMTIIDNKEIHDTWDCSDRIVEGYWVR